MTARCVGGPSIPETTAASVAPSVLPSHTSCQGASSASMGTGPSHSIPPRSCAPDLGNTAMDLPPRNATTGSPFTIDHDPLSVVGARSTKFGIGDHLLFRWISYGCRL